MYENGNRTKICDFTVLLKNSFFSSVYLTGTSHREISRCCKSVNSSYYFFFVANHPVLFIAGCQFTPELARFCCRQVVPQSTAGTQRCPSNSLIVSPVTMVKATLSEGAVSRDDGKPGSSSPAMGLILTPIEVEDNRFTKRQCPLVREVYQGCETLLHGVIETDDSESGVLTARDASLVTFFRC